MRRILLVMLTGLLSVLWLYSAGASEVKGVGKVVKPTTPAKPSEKSSCGDYGTSVHFYATPSEAARQALKEQKLVFVLHVSGLFEDSEFT